MIGGRLKLKNNSLLEKALKKKRQAELKPDLLRAQIE